MNSSWSGNVKQERICPVCGVMYSCIITEECPLCKLKEELGGDNIIQSYMRRKLIP